MQNLQDLEQQLDAQAARGDTRPDAEQAGDPPEDKDAARKAKKAAKAARKKQAAANKEAAKNGGEASAAVRNQKQQKQQKQQSKPRTKSITEKGEEATSHASERRGSVESQGSKPGAFVRQTSGSTMAFDDPKRKQKWDKKQVLHRHPANKQVALFSHLPQYEPELGSLSLQVGFSTQELHPAFVRLGLKYAANSITGSNARCLALLNAFKAFISDYETPPDMELARDMRTKIDPMIRFIIDCRPMSVGMGNAVRYIKHHLNLCRRLTSQEQAKQELIDKIDDFITKRIEAADTVIAKEGAEKIKEGDVILTFAKSHVVEKVIKKAFDDGKVFKVIIVDSRPHFEGQQLLRRLTKHGIKCTYLLINALSFVMQEVSKVFLGGYAMLANGALVSRVGSAVVGMMAHTYNVPVLVCCETYKFYDRTQLDSTGINELGDPDTLITTTDRDDASHSDALTDWRDIKKLRLLNLIYDLTPVEFVSMVITEVGTIPPTSVPVILREHHKDQANF